MCAPGDMIFSLALSCASTGACFGKDVILSNNNLRDIGDAIALTFVQTVSLTQKDIFDLLPDYPMAYLVIRRAALGMALARALVKAAEIVKKSRLMASGRMPIGHRIRIHSVFLLASSHTCPCLPLHRSDLRPV